MNSWIKLSAVSLTGIVISFGILWGIQQFNQSANYNGNNTQQQFQGGSNMNTQGNNAQGGMNGQNGMNGQSNSNMNGQNGMSGQSSQNSQMSAPMMDDDMMPMMDDDMMPMPMPMPMM